MWTFYYWTIMDQEQKIFWTRKSSCVNARGIPPTAYQVLHMLFYPGEGAGVSPSGPGWPPCPDHQDLAGIPPLSGLGGGGYPIPGWGVSPLWTWHGGGYPSQILMVGTGGPARSILLPKIAFNLVHFHMASACLSPCSAFWREKTVTYYVF